MTTGYTQYFQKDSTGGAMPLSENLARMYRGECWCGARMAPGHLSCDGCRARRGLLREVGRRSEGHADDRDENPVAQVRHATGMAAVGGVRWDRCRVCDAAIPPDPRRDLCGACAMAAVVASGEGLVAA